MAGKFALFSKNHNHLWFLLFVLLAFVVTITAIVVKEKDNLTLSRVGSQFDDDENHDPNAVFDTRNMRYVSSRGLRTEFTYQHQYLETDDYSPIDHFGSAKAGDILHITNAQAAYETNWIYKIHVPVVMVINDGDQLLTTKLGEFMKFVNSDNCIHVFAQNCNIKHPKVSGLFIGLDLHSRMRQGSPCHVQENELIAVSVDAPAWEDRICKAHANFQHSHFQHHVFGKQRADCLKEIDPNVVVYQKDRVGRKECWEQMFSHKFVLCPSGNGVVCHREIEVWIGGGVPIFKLEKFNKFIEELYSDLPAIFVKNWKDVTPKLLKEFKYEPEKYNMNKLLLPYWIRKIRKAARSVA